MFTLPLVATRLISMQEGAGLKMERSLQSSAVMQIKMKTERNGDGTKEHREIGNRDTPRCGRGKKEKPRCSPGRSAWLVWHLTSLSLYTELITVMQRAQFYFNKAREREREREMGGINKIVGKHGKNATEHFLQKNKCVIIHYPDAVNSPPF